MRNSIRWLAVIFCLAAALALQFRLGLTPDVSWLLDVAGRVLGGEALYRDIIEYNPPFSVWLYLVPALLAAATGWPAAVCLYLLFVLLLVGVFTASIRILIRAGALLAGHVWLFALLWIGVFVVLPLENFLQREHIAILCLVPWLSLQVARWRTPAPLRAPVATVVLCSLSCAIIVMVKPHYAMAILMPVAALAIRSRSFRPVFDAENLIGAAIAAAYAVVALALYPDFLGTLYDTLAVIYLPVRTPEATVFFMACAAALGAALILWTSPRRWPPETTVPTLTALGHLAAVASMGRTFPYHVLPVFILLLLAAAALIRQSVQEGFADERVRLPRHAAAALLAAISLWLVSMVYLSGEDMDRAALAYLKAHHDGASVIAISPSFADSHPLIPLAGGHNVAPQGALVADAYGSIRRRQQTNLSLADSADIDAAIAEERHLYARAILRRRPDLVLVAARAAEGPDPAASAIFAIEVDGKTVGSLYWRKATAGDLTVYQYVGEERLAAQP